MRTRRGVAIEERWRDHPDGEHVVWVVASRGCRTSTACARGRSGSKPRHRGLTHHRSYHLLKKPANTPVLQESAKATTPPLQRHMISPSEYGGRRKEFL
jgi:hypothetical protein